MVRRADDLARPVELGLGHVGGKARLSMTQFIFTGCAAAMMVLAAMLQVTAWLKGESGDSGWQAIYACVAAFYAVLWWQSIRN